MLVQLIGIGGEADMFRVEFQKNLRRTRPEFSVAVITSSQSCEIRTGVEVLVAVVFCQSDSDFDAIHKVIQSAMRATKISGKECFVCHVRLNNLKEIPQWRPPD